MEFPSSSSSSHACLLFLRAELPMMSDQVEKRRLEMEESCGLCAGGGVRWSVVVVCASLVYYHCGWRDASLLSLFADVLIVLLCSLSILGLLFRNLNISVPVDPLEWQISQDTANTVIACLANTVGAAESVLRVAATGHDKRLFFKVVVFLYLLSAMGRVASGATIAYAGLCVFCLYGVVKNSGAISSLPGKIVSSGGLQDSG